MEYTVDEIKKAIEIVEQVYKEITPSSETTLDFDGDRYFVFDVGAAYECINVLSDMLRKRIGINPIHSIVKNIEEAEAVG